MEHPGAVLEQLLKTRNIKQIELAVRASISKTHLGAIIKGKRPISARVAVLLERCLGVSAKYWMGLQTEYDLQLEKKKGHEVSAKEEAGQIRCPPITTFKLGRESIWPYADADAERQIKKD